MIPGADSEAQRTILSEETAYAIIAIGWDPSASTSPDPTTLRAMVSKRPLGVARGDTLQLSVSNDTFDGDCEGGRPLSQTDADFVTQRIFPGAFAGFTYDASTCAVSPDPIASDGGVP